MDLEKRIAELEEELAEARAKVARLETLKSENEELKARVDDLHSELISLSPPKVPSFSDAPRPSGPATPSQATRAREKSRLMTWTTLVLVLVGVALAVLPYLMSHLDESHRSDGERTSERGLELPE